MVALTLAESLQLLCIDDYRGKITKSLKIRYAITCAIIMDLALEHKIAIVKGNKAKIEPKGSSSTSSALHNELLIKISNYWIRSVRRCVYKLGNRERKVRKQLLLSLQEKRIIKRKEGLLKRYSIINTTIKKDMIDTIRNLQTKDRKMGNYSYCLISLLRFASIKNNIPNTEFLDTPSYAKENITAIADNETRIMVAFVLHEAERFILINNILTNVADCLECCSGCA